LRRLLKGFFNWIFSAPHFLKIMGIWMLVTLLFGGVMLHQMRTSLSRTLYQNLAESTSCLVKSLASHIERPMATGDLFMTKRYLNRAMETHRGLRYIIVEDNANEILVHTFAGSVPRDLVGLRDHHRPGDDIVEVFSSEEGRIFEAAFPLLSGSAGRLRAGSTDQFVTKELSYLTRSLLLALGFCIVIGFGLTMLLTYSLTRPVQNLVFATKQISEGDFGFRAEVSSYDEIGKLAIAFNEMAQKIQKFRKEVKEKESARRALIEKLVLSQEEERKKIALDLHDQLGQSLSVLLLEIQSQCNGSHNPGNRCKEHEARISGLIDEVRRLAWGMHPSIVSDYGIDTALARYVNETSKHLKTEVDYQYICPVELRRLPARTEIALYRIAQEAITNIARHGDAAHASVILMRNEGGTLLLIEDDGIGFRPDSVSREGITSLGLTGMRERAALIGADFELESIPGKGTTIRVNIPQEKEQPCLSES
jgi:signal transduction histidine kinase